MFLNILHTKNLPIYDQLMMEESLLKTHNENFCIINEGTNKSIILGSSNEIKDFLNISLLNKNPISVIKRFSGGGTVLVDENTIFVSFIFSKSTLNFSYPQELFKWAENIYKKKFLKIFLYENDFIINNLKCGGNAQYIKKTRWLHHTSFLWDFCDKSMDYLLLPKKMPKYRKTRSHKNFLCRMKNYFPNKFL